MNDELMHFFDAKFGMKLTGLCGEFIHMPRDRRGKYVDSHTRHQNRVTCKKCLKILQENRRKQTTNKLK